MSLWTALFAYGVLGPGTVTTEPMTPHGQPSPPPPAVAPIDQAFLIQAARRQIESLSDLGKPYASAYVPPALQGLTCPAFVTLREDGALVAIGRSPAKPVFDSVLAAAEDALLFAAAKGRPVHADRARRYSLEIELLGPDVRVGTGEEPAERLAAAYEPGLEGIRAVIGGRDVYIRPSQILSREPECLDDEEPGFHCHRYRAVIDALLGTVGGATPEPADGTEPSNSPPAATDVARIEFFRFRTQHFWQRRPGERPVELVSGLRIVDASEVTPERIDEAIHQTAAHLLYRQLPEGLFAYEYLPGRDRYINQDRNWVRQAGAMWAVALYASATGDEEARRCSDRAIEVMRGMLRPRPGFDRTLFVATPDGLNKLGATALFGLTILDAPEPDRFLEIATAVGDACRTLQNPSGRFTVHFAAVAETRESQEYSPGEALLLIARLYDRFRDERWREALDRALPFYQRYYRESAGPAFLPWQMQAYGRAARTTAMKRYAEFVFDMADRLIASQLRADAAASRPSSEAQSLRLHDGGFDVYARGRTGIATAAYVEGMNEALRTARAFGDQTRADRYAEAVRRALRFVLQLQFKPEEGYYIRSPKDAVNGFRSNPADGTMRIDNAQHALAAMLGARSLLWPDTPMSPPPRGPTSRPGVP